MTVLQGTMQDGTVLPVQVDSQGRLVAEGLPGPAGPQGPAGPVGPEGPPGTGSTDLDALPALLLPALSSDKILVSRRGVNYEMRMGDLVSGLKVTHETDAIMQVHEVQGPVYSARTTTSAQPGTVVNPHLVFDGDENTYLTGHDDPGLYWVDINFSDVPLDHSLLRIKTLNCMAYWAHAGIPGNSWPTFESFLGPGSSATLMVKQSTPDNSGELRIYGVRYDGVDIVDGKPITQLRFSSGVSLEKFAVGDLLEEITADNKPGEAKGTISAIHLAEHTVDLALVTGSWGVGSRARRFDSVVLR